MSKLSQREIDELLHAQNLQQIGPYVNAGSPLECKCLKCDNYVSPRIASMKDGHRGCKFCAARDRAALKKYSPEKAFAIMVAAGVEPQEPYLNNHHPWMSICLTCGESVSPQFQNVRNGHAACKFCSGKAITNERAISIYLSSGAKPSGPYRSNKIKWPGICLTCGADVAPRLSDLQNGQGPCQSCGTVKRANSNRLPELEAIQRMLDAGAEPLEPWGNKNVDTPWISQCMKCDATITPSLHSVTSGQGPCIYCGILAGAQKIMFDGREQAEILKGYGFTALEPYPGMGNPWNTECHRCGSQSPRRMANIKTGHGCMKCAYEASRVPEELAVNAMRTNGWEPVEPYPGSSAPWKCRCKKCGFEQYPRLYSINNKRPSGCFSCGERTLGSIFYIIFHEEHLAYKVGVGKERRLDEHRWAGWKLIRHWELKSPVDAYRLEGEVLRHVRMIWELPQYLSNQDMRQHGATETFSALSHTKEEVIYLVQRLMVNEPSDTHKDSVS